MKPVRIGPACGRVRHALDEAMAEGALSLPPELKAHAARCPHCGREVGQLEDLLRRLRGGAARINLGPVPAVVDRVVAQTAPPPPPVQAPRHPDTAHASRRWVVGQVAMVAGFLLLMTGGALYLGLKVNQAVSGTGPDQVVDQFVVPFRNWFTAVVKGMR